jgi:hypothetical protein
MSTGRFCRVWLPAAVAAGSGVAFVESLVSGVVVGGFVLLAGWSVRRMPASPCASPTPRNRAPIAARGRWPRHENGRTADPPR